MGFTIWEGLGLEETVKGPAPPDIDSNLNPKP